jgi:tetratricopeptide (TPR) repeat protein
MSERRDLRKRWLVDPQMQGALVVRVILYCIGYLIAVTMMLLCWRISICPAPPGYADMYEMQFYYRPVLIASLLLLPLVAVDIIRFSNRLVGPLWRLRQSMRQLARGEHVEPIEFRETDVWQEVAADFNAILVRMRLHYDRGWACQEKGNLDKTIEDNSEVIRPNPELALAYYSRGIAYEQKSEHGKAIADYAQAFRLNPELALACAAELSSRQPHGQSRPAA